VRDVRSLIGGGAGFCIFFVPIPAALFIVRYWEGIYEIKSFIEKSD